MVPTMVWRIAPLVGAAFVLVWHTLQYNFVTDDAYISFVYARNLAENGALVFNASDLAHPVEGYTNFLWTALIACALLLGVSAEIGSLVLGAGFAIATLCVVFRLVEEVAPDSRFAALPSFLLAVCAGFACWASGGLETQMFTFFVVSAVWAVARSHRSPSSFRWVGPALALAAMTRPEGLLCAAIIGVHRVILNATADRRILPRKDELVAAAGFLILWAPWFGWRTWYYGYPFPNTYYVKASGVAGATYLESMRELGLHYIGSWATQSMALLLGPLAIVGALAHRFRSTGFRTGSLCLVLGGCYLIYALRVGGDFMGLHRFVLPATVLLIVLASLGILRLGALLANALRIESGWGAAALAGLVASLFVLQQTALTRRSVDPANLRATHGIDTPAYLDLYARDRARIGAHMRDCFRPGDFSIFGGVGAKPYHARAEGIDVFGLVSERIAHEVPRTRARAGHNKWGPDKLLAEHDPDFVFSCYSLHSQANKPHWNCSPSFWTRRGYEIITLHIPGLKERGEYYTFLAKKERAFDCPGQLR